MKNIFLAIFLMFMIVVAGCGGGPNSNNGPVKFAKLSITGAKALVAMGPIGSAQKLYKITDTDELVEVQALDASNLPVDATIHPVELYNVDARYFILVFSNKQGNIETHLVRKDTGNAFKLASTPTGFLRGGGKRLEVQTDNAGNLYYISASSGKLLKLNVQNESAIVETILSVTGDPTVEYFRVDSAGNALYTTTESDNKYRLIKAAGGYATFEPVNNPTMQLPFGSFLGHDGYFYLLWYYSGTKSEIVKQTVTGTTVNPPEVYSTITNDQFVDEYSWFHSFTFMADEYSVQNRVYLFDPMDYYLTEVHNNQAPPFAPHYLIPPDHNLIDTFTWIKEVDQTATDLYFFGLNGPSLLIKRVDPVAVTATTLLNTTDYDDIYKAVVLESGEMFVAARRLEGLVHVFGKVDGSAITVLQENVDVEFIERL